MSMTLVSVTETDTMTISRWESGDGFAITMYREKAPQPEITLTPALGRTYAIGSADIARLEANAATNNEAEELTTAWDQHWASRTA